MGIQFLPSSLRHPIIVCTIDLGGVSISRSPSFCFIHHVHHDNRLSGSPHSIPFCASPAKPGGQGPSDQWYLQLGSGGSLTSTRPDAAWRAGSDLGRVGIVWVSGPGSGAYEYASCLVPRASRPVLSGRLHNQLASQAACATQPVPRSFFACHPLTIPPADLLSPPGI